MKSKLLNLEPARQLMGRHMAHKETYPVSFKGLDLVIHPNVFNPAYTKVSGFLIDNIEITLGSKVLDMFTGSGSVAIFAAKKGASSVIGVDISAPAIACASENAVRNKVSDSIRFVQDSLWESILETEKYDVITANPPLLPVFPETLLEMAIADSPGMRLMIDFLQGCGTHMNNHKSRVFMAFSNACKVFVPNPIAFIDYIAKKNGLRMEISAEWDVGYEIYRILKFMLN